LTPWRLVPWRLVQQRVAGGEMIVVAVVAVVAVAVAGSDVMADSELLPRKKTTAASRKTLLRFIVVPR
jgi:hypothetical protein